MARIVPKQDREAWEQRGGRVRTDAKGRPVYVIRKQIGNHRFEVSTRKHTLDAALSEWAKFEKDPEGYRPGGDPSTAPVFLDNDLSEEFLGWSKNDKGNTIKWVENQRRAIAWWQKQLGATNLRRARLLDHILPALEGVDGRNQKIRVLKSLYGWLRKVRHLIAASEDPTFGTLSAQQSKPAQRTKSKVIPKAHYLLVREHLTGPWPDLLTVLAGTGWHLTELGRFAVSGTIEALPAATRVDTGAVGVLVCPMHKSGDTHRTAVSAEVLEAAKRVRARGEFSESKLYKAIKSACAAVKNPDGTNGITFFAPSHFRHSVATWAFEQGADPAAVSAFLGHKSPATTKKFYATLATVPKIPTLA